MNKAIKVVAKCIDIFVDEKGFTNYKFDKSLDILYTDYVMLYCGEEYWIGTIENGNFKITDAISIWSPYNGVLPMLLDKYCYITDAFLSIVHIALNGEFFEKLESETNALLWEELGELQNPTIEQINMYQKALNGV